MGGIEKTINLMARGTSDEFDVRVLVNSGTRTSSVEIIDGVVVTRVGEWGRAASAPVSPAFVGALSAAAADCDLLHFHHPNPTGDVARLLGRVRTPAVMTYHSDVVRQKWAMWAYGPVLERTLSACRLLMPTSAEYMQGSPWLSRHRAKCRVVPLGLDTTNVADWLAGDRAPKFVAAVRAKYPPPNIAFCGKLRAYKGLGYLLEAMVKVVNADLLLVGDGPMRKSLEARALALGVAARVHFLGERSEEDKFAVLAASEVFCFPSHRRSEAFGLSQIEAMACGVPVVGCELGTGTTFVNRDGETGLVVPPADPDALAAALNSLLHGDPARRRMLGQAAAQRARKLFSAERMCADLKAVYREALAMSA